MKAVERMDDMSKDFKLLSNIVKKGLNSGGCEEGAEPPEGTAKKAKTRGGAVSVSDLSAQFPNPKQTSPILMMVFMIDFSLAWCTVPY